MLHTPHQRRFLGPVVAIGGLLVLCGASPAPEGNETTVGVGLGTYEYRSGGCGGAPGADEGR